jgi:hypothetical protein
VADRALLHSGRHGYGDNMSYQIEIHVYHNDADAREEAERLSRCNVDGVGATIYLNARGPNCVVDHFHPRRGWDIGSTDPEDAKNTFSLLIELDAETESDARRVPEVFCAKAQVSACSLLLDMETGVDEYDVSTGWRKGPDEDAEH